MSLAGAHVASAAIILHFEIGEEAGAARAERAAAGVASTDTRELDSRVKPRGAPQIAR